MCLTHRQLTLLDISSDPKNEFVIDAGSVYTHRRHHFNRIIWPSIMLNEWENLYKNNINSHNESNTIASIESLLLGVSMFVNASHSTKFQVYTYTTDWMGNLLGWISILDELYRFSFHFFDTFVINLHGKCCWKLILSVWCCLLAATKKSNARSVGIFRLNRSSSLNEQSNTRYICYNVYYLYTHFSW